jgi:tRNA(Ile2) C34 agmatinyltransferase TiaS
MLGDAPDYANCPECGTSVPVDGIRPHRCDERHRADRIVAIAVSAAEGFEQEFHRYLETPQGRFELFYAARDRGAG